MNPIKPNDHKWEVFLKTFAEEAEQVTNRELIKKIVENLTLIYHNCDRIGQLIKRSPTCYNDFNSAIRSSAIKDCWDQKIRELIKSIKMSLPIRIETPFRNPDIALKPIASFSTEILASVTLIVSHKEFSSQSPDYKTIDSLFSQLEILAWKTVKIPKECGEYKEILNQYSLLLDTLDRLFSSHLEIFNSVNGIRLSSVLISRLCIEHKLAPLLGFLKYHSDEILLRNLIQRLPTLSLDHLERFFLVLNPLVRDIDCIVAIVKDDSQAAENLKTFLNNFCQEYHHFDFTEQHRPVSLKFFNLLFQLQARMPELIDEQVNKILNDTVTIYFDNGPLCLRKHQLMLISKSSLLINELIFGNMRETVEFAEKNTLFLKEICRNDFRLMVQRYFSISEQGELDPKYWIKLAYLGEFLDIKFIREDTAIHLQKFAESLSKTHTIIADCESCATLEALCRVLSKLNLSTVLEGLLTLLKLYDLSADIKAFSRIIVECQDRVETLHFFKLYCLRYSLIKKHFPELLKEVHETEVAPLIKKLVNIALNHPEKSYDGLKLVRDALMTQPFEKSVEFTDSEFDDFVVMRTKQVEVLIDLDLSDCSVKLKSLEALKGLFVGKLHLKKGNFSTRELLQVSKLFPSAVVS